MSRLKMAAVAATLALAPISPALAQEAAQAEAPANPAPELSPADQAFQAQGTAFEAENAKMGQELQAIMADGTADNATKIQRADEVLARYTPSFNAFAEVMKAYLTELANRPERSAERDQILAAAETVPAQISGAPDMIRAQIRQAIEAPAAPAAPQ